MYFSWSSLCLEYRSYQYLTPFPKESFIYSYSQIAVSSWNHIIVHIPEITNYKQNWLISLNVSFLYSNTRFALKTRSNAVGNLQLNGLGFTLLGSNAFLVALDCLHAGKVTPTRITLVDQELDVHLWRNMGYAIVLGIFNRVNFNLRPGWTRGVCALGAWCHCDGPSCSDCDLCDSLTWPLRIIKLF